MHLCHMRAWAEGLKTHSLAKGVIEILNCKQQKSSKKLEAKQIRWLGDEAALRKAVVARAAINSDAHISCSCW